MAEDKRIGISIDTSGYDEGFNRIQRRADEVASDMIRNSRELDKSSKEIIKDLEEQIRMIERRNKLSSQYKQEQLQVGQLRGSISEEKFAVGQRQLKIETSEEKMHTTLLREIADNIKSGDRDQLSESKSSAERLYEGIKTSEDFEDALGGDDVGEGPRKGRARGGGVYGVGYTNKIVGAGNIFEAGAGALAETTRRAMGLAGIGLVGTLAALGVGKAIQAALPYEKALGVNVGVTGGFTGMYEGFLRTPGENMGFTMNETLARRVDMSRARMSGRGVGGATLNALALERGLGLDPSLIMGMETLTRSGGAGAMETTHQMANTLRATGMVRGGDMSAMPEYLQTLVTLSQEQVKELGKVSDGNIKMIVGISNLDESFKNPEVLQQVINQIKGGLTQAQSPQQEALQYSILSRIRPGASLFQLQKMREDPFSEDNQQYLPETLKMLEKISGGNKERFYMQIGAYFGTGAKRAEDIGRGYEEGRLQDILGQNFTEGKGAGDVYARANAAAGSLMVSSSQFINVFSQTGENLVQGMKSILEGFEEAVNQIIQSQKNIQEGADALYANAAELNGIKKVLFNLLGAMAEARRYGP